MKHKDHIKNILKEFRRDGSTEGLDGILEEYANKILTYIPHEKKAFKKVVIEEKSSSELLG